jgi:hypothetical protein
MKVYVERQIPGFYDYDTMVFDVMRDERNIRRRYLRLNNKPGETGQNSIWWGIPHVWHPLTAHIALPKTFRPGDRIVIRPQNVHPGSVVYFDDLEFLVTSR